MLGCDIDYIFFRSLPHLELSSVYVSCELVLVAKLTRQTVAIQGYWQQS
jgi:hypothetical protein